MRALLMVLVAGTAWAQSPPPQQAPKVPKTMLTQIPGLYWARVGTVVNKAIPQMPAAATVRIFMDTEGAITAFTFVRRSALPRYNSIIEFALAEFTPSAKRRLPVARDPELREKTMRGGVIVKIGGQHRKSRIPLSNSALSFPIKSARKAPDSKAPLKNTKE